MNIKSLLLGSAAALAAVSGAQAADAIVAAEPEPMEYVRVCDAFGTGYFYIPGTETCLQIGGWVRFEVGFGRDTFDRAVGAVGASDWDARGRAYVTFTAKTDTELGTLTSFIGIEGDPSNGGDSDNVYVDEAYIQLGGFKAGYFYNWWDKGIVGETDSLGENTLLNAVSYTYDGGAFQAAVAVEELENAFTGPNASLGTNGVGVSAIVTAAVGGVAFDLLGSYDTENEEGAIRALLSAEVGPGTFQLAGIWASDPSAYWSKSEWSVAAAYALKATDKLTITPAIQYWDELGFVGGEEIKYGVTLGYQITDGLTSLVTVNYVDSDIAANDDQVNGFFRLQRSF